MKTHKNLYKSVYSLRNLVLAWKEARKGKTKKDYVIEFEKNLRENLLQQSARDVLENSIGAQKDELMLLGH